VLTGSGHENTVYELSGPPRTYGEFARAIGEVLGREVPVQHVDVAEYERMMGGFGLPDYLVELLVDAQRGMRQGALDVESEDLERLLGRPPTPLKESVARILDSAGAKG
jgi:NAD(P)H dehydrogenase (quinone)